MTCAGALFLGVVVGLPSYPLPRRDVDIGEEVLQLAVQVRQGSFDNRVRAIRTLGLLRDRAKPALGALSEVLYDPKLQIHAVEAVRNIVPDIYRSIEPMLFDRDLNEQMEGSARIGQMGDAAVNVAPFLREHAMRVLYPRRPGEMEMRASCATRDAATLAQIAPEYPGTAPLVRYLLGRALEEERATFRQTDLLDLVQAALVLYRHRPEEHRSLVPYLLRAMDGPARLEVVQRIAQNPTGDPEVVRRLRTLQAGTNSQVRDAAATALKRIQEYLDKLGKPMPA